MSVGSGFLIHLPLEEGANMELDDLFGNDDLESIERKVDFERMMDGLDIRDKRILYLYANGFTYDEIGEKIGLSKGRICQILSEIKQSLLKLDRE